MKEEKLLLALNDMEEEDLMDALIEHPYSAKRFRPGVILAAALLVGTLALSAAAMSENGWFQLFFSREKGQALTQGQVALIQTSTKTYGQSVTKDGYTVTLESVIADPENCYMNLRITGPAGTCMNNEAGYGSRSITSPDALYQTFAPVSGAVFSGVGSWQNLEDEDPDDNQVSILYRWRLDSASEVNFETEKTWRLTIRDLAAWGNGEPDTVLAHGDICFDIVFDNLSLAQLDFVQQPIPYTFRLPGLTETANGFLTSCLLRPLGAELTISGCDEAVGFGILQVVMKDGSQAQLHANIFGNGSYSYTSVVPMDLEEVDYLLLENGTQLYPIDP